MAQKNLCRSETPKERIDLAELIEEVLSELLCLTMLRNVVVRSELREELWIDGVVATWRALVSSLLDGIVKAVPSGSRIVVRNEIIDGKSSLRFIIRSNMHAAQSHLQAHIIANLGIVVAAELAEQSDSCVSMEQEDDGVVFAILMPQPSEHWRAPLESQETVINPQS